MTGQLDPEIVPGPARRRGHPPIVVTEEALEQRRLSKQRVNDQCPESVDGNGPTRKCGRPPIIVTEEVLEQRRLSRQRDSLTKDGKPPMMAAATIIHQRLMARSASTISEIES